MALLNTGLIQCSKMNFFFFFIHLLIIMIDDGQHDTNKMSNK